MIERSHQTIVDALRQDKKIYVDRYYGQLSDYKAPDLSKDEFPKILVDFTGDRRDGMDRVLSFNLYFVHIAYSANKDYRQASLSTLAAMMEKAEKHLDKIETIPITTKSSRKIFDAKIDQGYLSVFSRGIEAHITDEGVYQWMDS